MLRRLRHVGSKRFSTVRAMVVAFVLVSGALVAAGTPASGAPGFPAGCDPSRTAVMHHADGAGLGNSGFVPCLTTAFYGFGEANPVVTSSGAVMYGGAWDPERGNNQIGFEVSGNIARTVDGGATWDFLALPPSPPSNARGTGDPRLWRDPLTDRVWFTEIGFALSLDPPLLCQTHISFSDDGGATWTNDPDPPGWGCPRFDFPQLFTAPHTTSPPAAQGSYPNVVYICKSQPGRECYKSLDGAQTLDLIPGAGAHNPRTGGVDGTIYGIAGGRLHYSTDEGTTWTIGAGAVPFTSASTGPVVDSVGNVYVVGLVNRVPAVSYSTDQGATWSAPIAVQMPGVGHAHQPVMAVPPLGDPGMIAVAYIGNGDATDTPTDAVHTGGPHHGYITTANDIFADNPVFRSVQVDSDDDALLPFGFMRNGATTVTTSRADYIGVYVDGSRTPWAFFYKDGCQVQFQCSPPDPHPEFTNWIGAIGTVAPKGAAHAPGG